MIPEIGLFALLLAFLTALLQGISPILRRLSPSPSATFTLPGRAAILQCLLLLLSFGTLIWSYVFSDFSVENVALNSHTAKPMIYKISGAWGNHEGSMLLWILCLSLFGAAFALRTSHIPERLQHLTLSVQGWISSGFLAFILFTSNPFTRLNPAPLEGQGLNPLLQDPGLAFHPPFLYLGYVGFSIAFSLAVAGLIEGRIDKNWAALARPWTLAAWSFLTLGIGLGSWWAYHELGWGGYWFWDPVENASLMPWLTGTALLHSLVVCRRREALRGWCALLAIMAFSLSLIGTFLVRSGVLTSVHAFANDPARGVFILGFLVVVIGLSLTLYAVRAPKLAPGSGFSPVSQESGLLFNNLLLVTACATIFLGTLYPLFLDVLGGGRVSVGAPYFNATFGPIALAILFLAGVVPFLDWKKSRLFPAIRQSALAVIAGLAGGGLTYFLQPIDSLLAPFGIGLATFLLMATLILLARRIGLFRYSLNESFQRLWRLPRETQGMILAHSGLAILAAGLIGASSWPQQVEQVVTPKSSIELGPYTLTLLEVATAQGPNYVAQRGTIEVHENDELLTYLFPEKRRYPAERSETTEAAIYDTFLHDLYVVVGEKNGNGYAIRAYIKPLVSWIWYGILIMAFGGGLTLSTRRQKYKNTKENPAVTSSSHEVASCA